MAEIDSEHIKRILVRSPNWVGDAVMSLPALHALRRIFSGGHITVATPAGTADIFRDGDFANEVLIQKKSGLFSTFQNASEWRRGRFDLAVLLQNAFAAAATARLAGIPLRIGYDTDRRGTLLTTAIPLPEWKDQRHESFYYLNVAAEVERAVAGTSSLPDEEPRFELAVSEERRDAARKLIAETGGQPDRPLGIICPGSVNSRAKRWPVERYAALSDRLIEQGFEVVLIGSPGELEVSEHVVRHSKDRPIVLTGRTSVAEATALISVAQVLITNDTGPAHIGAALQTPTLVIFGPTNPLTTYPLSRNAEIIRHPPDCAPCMLRDCPIDHRCMTAISPDEVFQRAMSLISEKKIQIVG